MTIHEFELLNDDDKEEAVWNHANFLVNFDEGNKMCDIYELYDFYVAFCYELHKNLKATITAAVWPDALPYMSSKLQQSAFSVKIHFN